jgi:ABC-type Fe3+-siderophore transport system permease subunit
LAEGAETTAEGAEGDLPATFTCICCFCIIAANAALYGDDVPNRLASDVGEAGAVVAVLVFAMSSVAVSLATTGGKTCAAFVSLL